LNLGCLMRGNRADIAVFGNDSFRSLLTIMDGIIVSQYADAESSTVS
jgi:hypothetical protein